MKTKTILTGLLIASIPFAAQAELPSITLEISGADPATGIIEASLFDSADNFLEEVYLQEKGDVREDGTFTAEFVGLEEGEYAIVVVHDANDNGILDTGFLGFGGEVVAYSNDATSWIGRPSFDDAKFTVGDGNQKIEISLD